jgi:hypothetical protein
VKKIDPFQMPERHKWSEAFNALPEETRRITCGTEVFVRLQHLQFERDRIKQAADFSLRKIDEHERNLLAWLKELGEPPPTSEQE